MKLQLLSDLHLERETCELTPAPGAEALVLAGDIDSSWAGLQRFANWPVPVLLVAGNHEFDRRDIDLARAELAALCTRLGIRLLEREVLELRGRDGRLIRFLGTTRWCDFDVFGTAERERAMRAATYFVEVMRATRAGQIFDPAAVRAEALICRAWLDATLAEPRGDAAATVVVTHFAPSLKSADPRYGRQVTTANFCNDDEALLPRADVWLHGHLHCRLDYRIGATRVLANPRGYVAKREHEGWDSAWLIEV